MILTLFNVTGPEPVPIGVVTSEDGVVTATSNLAPLLTRPAGIPRTVMASEGDAFLTALANQYSRGTRVLAVLTDDDKED